MAEIIWVNTKDMALELGVHRNTLGRLKGAGYFVEGDQGHYRKKNPLSPRGDFVWHRTRVLLKMNAT